MIIMTAKVNFPQTVLDIALQIRQKMSHGMWLRNDTILISLFKFTIFSSLEPYLFGFEFFIKLNKLPHMRNSVFSFTF